MTSLLTLATLGSAIWFSLDDPTYGWIIHGVALVILFLILQSVRLNHCIPQNDLSPRANEILRDYGHYYLMPSTGNDFCGYASMFAFFGWIITAIGLYKAQLIGVPLGLINHYAFGQIAKSFNPTAFFLEESDKAAHLEVIAWFERRM